MRIPSRRSVFRTVSGEIQEICLPCRRKCLQQFRHIPFLPAGQSFPEQFPVFFWHLAHNTHSSIIQNSSYPETIFTVHGCKASDSHIIYLYVMAALYCKNHRIDRLLCALDLHGYRSIVIVVYPACTAVEIRRMARPPSEAYPLHPA